MPQEDSGISHVSDTALLVAACRAMETARPDGLVRDPFASRLGGERGMALAQELVRPDIMCLVIGMRSRFLDELVPETIAAGKIEAVLSLGAGLDSRPWRLDLPANLRWIEVDFPDMLDYKSRMLAGQPANCRVEQLAADLNEVSGRSEILAAVGSAPALMITEGLLMYLPGATVEALAVDAPKLSGVRYWLSDLTSRQAARRVRAIAMPSIQALRAETYLEGTAAIEVLERTGWKRERFRSYRADAFAAAPERMMKMVSSLSSNEPPPPPDPNDPSGVHLFEKVEL